MAKTNRLGALAAAAGALAGGGLLMLVLMVARPAEATFPGKNGRIAYSGFDEKGKDLEIYTIDSGGGNTFRVTPNPSGDVFRVVPPPPPPEPFPGIRWYPSMGVYRGTANYGWASDPSLVQDQFNTYVGTAKENSYLELGDGDNERYWFEGGSKYTWRDMLVNENLAPSSRAQARDPNSSNYKWNQNDVVREMLGAQCVSQGKCKLSIFIATTATSAKNPVPLWLKNDPRDLTWRDGQGKDHVRLDKDAGWRAMADFLVALTKEYGDDPRISSIVIGEYYTNPDGGGLPSDLDMAAFKNNMELVWADMIQNAPRDANGERINITQSQPQTKFGQTTAQEIANIGVGISGSDPTIFQANDFDKIRRRLYGVVPLRHQVNAGFLTRGETTTWDGTPNPWGYTQGQVVPIRYEHVAWYHSNKGVAPLDSLMMQDISSLVGQFQEGYDQFGPNGTRRAQWGQIPNYPPVP